MGFAQNSEKRFDQFMDHDSEELPHAEFAARWKQRTDPKTGEAYGPVDAMAQ